MALSSASQLAIQSSRQSIQDYIDATLKGKAYFNKFDALHVHYQALALIDQDRQVVETLLKYKKFRTLFLEREGWKRLEYRNPIQASRALCLLLLSSTYDTEQTNRIFQQSKLYLSVKNPQRDWVGWNYRKLLKKPIPYSGPKGAPLERYYKDHMYFAEWDNLTAGERLIDECTRYMTA